MKFSEYRYERPDAEAFIQAMVRLLEELKNAGSPEESKQAVIAINRLRSEFDTMQTLVSIRHSIDTRDEFYEAEQAFMDETGPVLEEYITEYYRALVQSPYRSELEQEWGTQLFRIAEISLKTFHPSIIEDLQAENKRTTEYSKLIASAQIEFDGQTLNLSQLVPFEEALDRDVRKRASDARYAFMAEHGAELDRIFDELVQIRTRIAGKLGYPSFVELGYDRMMRTDYNAGMVERFRRQVLERIVPAAEKLWKRQAERIGLDGLKLYDEPVSFRTGNAAPKGDPDWIVAGAERMYREMSPETNEFFTFMRERELMDLVSKPGKRGGGYCTFISGYESPFIFSNFNGTSKDIDVMTHEVGHAFQVYQSRAIPIPEYEFPTYEACEIHSMSMEFLAWPWMEQFFGEEADKYRFAHLESSLEFIPYGVAVDEFQHYVYRHPEATPAERNRAWRDIEQKYLPQRDYDGNAYLEQGGFWQKQAHIYRTPFYYIDYTLAQICAFQFWKRAGEDRAKAWSDYLTLCKAGGSRSFLGLVELAGLISPFEDGCVDSVIGEIEGWLNGIDDKAL
ncbi:M3 family oligoendopeptidase [Gorillibacterium sp. sgz500922]|uniref:M3 family oligoendopeptidase n=1 Tax=Gorillibacterium sp. sgz500922 TaxID=3446694 RepID=UPI003F674B33